MSVKTVSPQNGGFIMHLSMLSPRGGGTANPREFDNPHALVGWEFDNLGVFRTGGV